MSLYFRMLWILLRGFFLPRTESFEEPSLLNFRVWPHDVDVNIHLNNGRYLTLMDLGRIDLMFRAGVLNHVIKKKWVPLVGSSVISYRRPLNLFKKFQLRSTVAFWDEKWFYIRQEFLVGNELASLGYVKVCLGQNPAEGKGTVPTGDVLALMSVPMKAPEPEDDIKQIFSLKSSYMQGRKKPS